jgi:flagellar biogenesis protein FliO
VLGLIGATAWAVRRFGSGRLGGAGMRGRQPRLAVIDYASVDARRRLILVRRDNVEHLLMIGGPTDVVVEPNIVRAMPASREVTLPRPPAPAETLPRAIPLPDNGNGSWPLQPEPAAAPPPRRAPRIEPMPEEAGSWPLQQHTETPPRPQRDTLAALADDLAAHPIPPVAPVPPVAPRNRPAAAGRLHPVEPRPEPRTEPRAEPRAEPRMPVQPANAEATSAADQNLADMAHRLEAALRKPKAVDAREAHAPAAAARAAPPPEHAAEVEAAPPPPPPPPPSPPLRAARPAEAKPVPAEAKAKEGKALYDSLEQEMASLLGRPAGKT